MCGIENVFYWLLAPTPTKESVFFVLGILLGIVIERWGYSKPQGINLSSQDVSEDRAKKLIDFWLIGPIGFFVAVAAVYDKKYIYNHWLFGNKKLMGPLIYSTDFIFGLVLGVILVSIILNLKRQLTAVPENISTEKKQKNVAENKIENEEINLSEPQTTEETAILPTAWDRFTAQRQINYLESSLAYFDNLTDRQSLQFWKERQNETEENGFIFRLSFLEEDLSKLNLQTIPEKNYLSIEFWKTRRETFRIRTTSGSTDNPKKYTDVTPEQREELEPHVSFWYEKFK